MGRYGNFVNRLVIGKEKSEDYARNSLPSNRWELFWDIFKSRFGKLFLINIITLLFFLPLVALLFFRYLNVVNYGSIMPYASGFGVGYQAPIPADLAGLTENIVFTSNLTTFLFLPITLMIAFIGMSGSFYVMRNLVWTEGVFFSNDFWRGIKKNIKQFLIISIVYSLVFYLSILTISLADWKIASGVIPWLFTILKVLCYVILIIISLIMMHMLPMSVTYELKITQLFKNAFFFALANPISSAFFLAIGAFPFFFLMFGEFMMAIGLVLIIIFGFSLVLLIWTVFCQGLYDKYINDKVQGAVKNRGIYKKQKKDQSKSIEKYKEQLEATSVGMLSEKPIKPITDEELTLAELPQSFNRSDIEKLNASRKALYEDNERYIAEHMGDKKYVMASQNRVTLEELDEQAKKRIEKAKKELESRNKKKKKK